MYIFGYGSLMNEASRTLTGHTGRSVPAVVHGMIRSWSKIDDTYKASPVAVVRGDGEVNGVLLEVDDMALKEFDIREAGYHRVELRSEQIECLDRYEPQGPVWIYIVEEANAPCTNSPIVMSYVDTVLAGCLEISDTFARHFVEHTQGWHHPLKNDRDNPVYSRVAGVESHHQERIDELIACWITD
ncbi:gamma-glutamylcyclotransferase [Vibrio hannami]|uniref:gamma-glutamylcyclotransferase family protein n=1 Tax=Vibrio hannami TaxID=2717094 RepID=UPI00240FDCB0|nr:gamma-glutamylcyclotransferase family protein [Vibrio hannami]MDG3088523.1 gamma-glutamylcyclotransferase [Vibrio hannami]